MHCIWTPKRFIVSYWVNWFVFHLFYSTHMAQGPTRLRPTIINGPRQIPYKKKGHLLISLTHEVQNPSNPKTKYLYQLVLQIFNCYQKLFLFFILITLKMLLHPTTFIRLTEYSSKYSTSSGSRRSITGSSPECFWYRRKFAGVFWTSLENVKNIIEESPEYSEYCP